MNPRAPPPGPVENDEDGNPIPQPEAGSDLADLIQLAHWAREQDFELAGPIRVGKIVIQGFRDIRQARKWGPDRPAPAAAAAEPTIWDLHDVPDDQPG